MNNRQEQSNLNELKRRRALAYLGTKHVLHPASTFEPKHKPILTTKGSHVQLPR